MGKQTTQAKKVYCRLGEEAKNLNKIATSLTSHTTKRLIKIVQDTCQEMGNAA